MSSKSSSKGLWEFVLSGGLAFLGAYLFNFVWESIHSVWLYGDHDLNADRYVRMIGYVSGVDAFFVLAIFLFISLAWRDAFWLRRMNAVQILVVLLAGMLVSGIVEYRAVYVLKEWRYGPNMPIILGVGLSPLIQISVTGLGALWLTGRLLYRCGPYSTGGS